MTHPLPYASWETRGWWEGAGRGELVLQRCTPCGARPAQAAGAVRQVPHRHDRALRRLRPRHGAHVHGHPPEPGPAVQRAPAVRAGLRRARRGAAGADQHRRRRPGRRRASASRSSPTSPSAARDDGEAFAVPRVPAGMSRRMILDLHTHSVRSDDGRAKVDNYCQWIRRKELPLDGIVLTEHRQFDDESDYRDLEDEYGLLILKASEVETDYGHVPRVRRQRGPRARRSTSPASTTRCRDVLEAAKRCGGVRRAVPPGPARTSGCSRTTSREGPGRGRRGGRDLQRRQHPRRGRALRARRPSATATAASAAATRTSSAASGCAPPSSTDDIATIDDLVTALRAGRCEARTWRT